MFDPDVNNSAEGTATPRSLLISCLISLIISIGAAAGANLALAIEPSHITLKPWHNSHASSWLESRHYPHSSPIVVDTATPPELMLSSAALTLPLRSGAAATLLKAAAAGGWAYLVKLIYARLHDDRLAPSLTNLLQNPDDKSLEELIQNHPAFLADEAQNPLPRKPTDPMAPPDQLWPSEQDQNKRTGTTRSHQSEAAPSISARDAFKQLKIAAGLHELHVATAALPSAVLMRRLAPYLNSAADHISPIQAPELLAAFDQSFPSRLTQAPLDNELPPATTDAATQTKHMQLKYLLLSKFIFQEHPHLSDYRAILMTPLETLQSYATTIQNFLNAEFSRSGGRAAITAPLSPAARPHHAEESLSEYSHAGENHLEILTAIYTHVSPDQYQKRLQQLAGQLHGVAATTLYETMRACLSTTGLKVFLLTFMELKPADYGLDAQTFTSYHNLLRRMLSELTPATVQDSPMHQLFEHTQLLWSQLTPEQLAPIASELAIPAAHHQELLMILKAMATQLATHPFKLGQYYLLSAKVFSARERAAGGVMNSKPR